jgi:hypothetical protein
MVLTKQPKGKVVQRAKNYFLVRNYATISQSENQIVLEEGKDLNIGLLILAVFFFLIGAVIYYLISAKHKITVTLQDTSDGLKVDCFTNTQESFSIANNFLNSLSDTEDLIEPSLTSEMKSLELDVFSDYTPKIQEQWTKIKDSGFNYSLIEVSMDKLYNKTTEIKEEKGVCILYYDPEVKISWVKKTDDKTGQLEIYWSKYSI